MPKSNNMFKTTLAAGVAVAAMALAVPSLGVAQCAPKNPCLASVCANNPCNPCCANNPCAAKNPCNPCAAKNPCNPCAAKNPCNPCAAKNPCAAN